MSDEIINLRAENKRLLDVLSRIVASDPKHSRFAELVQAEAREAIEICCVTSGDAILAIKP